MSDTFYNEIPSLDLADFTSGDEKSKLKFVEQLGAAYHDIGFVAIKNHELSDDLCKELYGTIEDFFNLPEKVKQKYEVPELHGQRGYVGKGKEHAKGRLVGDLKEFYHVGQEVMDGDPIQSEYPDNIWPNELLELESIAVATYQCLERVGKQMLRAIALYLKLEEDYFEAKVHNGNSILRPIHYFPIDNPDSVPEDAVRAAEHGDINLITLLVGASADGLQVLRRDGEWISIKALPEQIIVNVGDMLARLTNEKLKSTIHRVVNPSGELMTTSRFSIPFFMHPRSEMSLACLPSCVDALNPKKFDDMLAGEFLQRRLTEIGLRNK